MVVVAQRQHRRRSRCLRQKEAWVSYTVNTFNLVTDAPAPSTAQISSVIMGSRDSGVGEDGLPYSAFDADLPTATHVLHDCINKGSRD